MSGSGCAAFALTEDSLTDWSKDTVQYYIEADVSTAVATHFDNRLGNCSYTDGRCAESCRLFRRSILPGSGYVMASLRSSLAMQVLYKYED